MDIGDISGKIIKAKAKVRVGVKVGFKAVYSEATYKRILEDVIFIRRKAEEGGDNDPNKKRYARVVILLLALYLESLSNLLFDELVTNNLESIDTRTDVPEPIRRFRAVYRVCMGKELDLNTDGIQDVFTPIRNKIFAHPAGRAQSQTATGNRVWRPLEKHIIYRKFKDFPLHYSHFTLDHADTIINEVKDFSTGLLKALSSKVPQKQISEWWPSELVKWSEERKTSSGII